MMECFIDSIVDDGCDVKIITINGFHMNAKIIFNAIDHIEVIYAGKFALVYKHAISTIIR